jgi:hypothetical protein
MFCKLQPGGRQFKGEGFLFWVFQLHGKALAFFRAFAVAFGPCRHFPVPQDPLGR